MPKKRFDVGDKVKMKADSDWFFDLDKEYYTNLPGVVQHHFNVHGEWTVYVEYDEDDVRYIPESELELAK